MFVWLLSCIGEQKKELKSQHQSCGVQASHTLRSEGGTYQLGLSQKPTTLEEQRWITGWLILNVSLLISGRPLFPPFISRPSRMTNLSSNFPLFKAKNTGFLALTRQFTHICCVCLFSELITIWKAFFYKQTTPLPRLSKGQLTWGQLCLIGTVFKVSVSEGHQRYNEKVIKGTMQDKIYIHRQYINTNFSLLNWQKLSISFPPSPVYLSVACRNSSSLKQIYSF